ncbi:MAG: ABC transporter ATP-binding protein [Phycisphaerae bacterium]
MSEPIVIETKGLTKRFGEFCALDNLTISMERGQILGFIGPNGAGKTTTIKILVGLSRPTSGTASICGVDCTTDARKIKRLVGYMPDTFGTYDNMRVQEYLDFFGAAFKIPRRERLQRIEAVMETTGATYMRDRYVETLSHGMKQRVGIARTLLHDPQVLILDEPANGLDPTARVEMRQIILKLAAMGKTIIVTSHILPELSRICNVVAIITGGKLRAFGSLDEIMRDVRQHRMMELQLLNESALDQAAAIVQSRLEKNAQVTLSRAEAVVRFTTEQPDEVLATLLKELMAAGLPVAQFREEPQDLEDAFLSVTQRTAQGGPADPITAAVAAAGTEGTARG